MLANENFSSKNNNEVVREDAFVVYVNIVIRFGKCFDLLSDFELCKLDLNSSNFESVHVQICICLDRYLSVILAEYPLAFETK